MLLAEDIETNKAIRIRLATGIVYRLALGQVDKKWCIVMKMF